jgi:hypothetical protein
MSTSQGFLRSASDTLGPLRVLTPIFTKSIVKERRFMSSGNHFGLPVRHGYVEIDGKDVHVWTEFKWADGTVRRRWHVAPENVDADAVRIQTV